MAFFALMSASGKNYVEPIIQGLSWIFGNNELKTDLRNERMSVIWRNIHQSRTDRYMEEARAFINSSAVIQPATGLNILYECHPYHLGWLLFALSDPGAESVLATPFGDNNP